MRILLDECLPRALKRLLAEHEVQTVPEMGWAGIRNGDLLRLMDGVFDVFMTIDGNLQYQQNLADIRIRLVVFAAPDNTLDSLSPLIPQFLTKIKDWPANEILRLQSENRDAD